MLKKKERETERESARERERKRERVLGHRVQTRGGDERSVLGTRGACSCQNLFLSKVSGVVCIIHRITREWTFRVLGLWFRVELEKTVK